MNSKLELQLKKIFNLTDSEFHADLTKDDVSSWDSLRHMALVTTLEEEYRINLSMEDILEINSIPTLLKILKTHGVAIEK